MTDFISTALISGRAIGAMLGAAFGDSLGWPNERPYKSKILDQSNNNLKDFKKWIRRSSGYFPYEESIEIGEYSDDTQLILCIGRSLLHGKKWWDYFTRVELPFWTLYERGGGGATKRSVNAWIDGKFPWSNERNEEDIKQYFEAGGNGVAMRILPHVIYLLNNETFTPLATNIMLDGIATHGHPRALLGALAYGYALWISMKRKSRLAYGELIENLLNNLDEWTILPDKFSLFDEWMFQANSVLKDYLKHWETTKLELHNYLKICQGEISKGAFCIDNEVLKNLNCFDKQQNGSGTVAAITSIYLASRYATDPISGVIKAAYAVGTDTDTIASMTGGLSGSVNGADWLLSIKNDIQDYSYIEKISLFLIENNDEINDEIDNIRRSKLKNWSDNIVKINDSNSIQLPDGRKAVLKTLPEYIGKSKRYKVEFKKLISDDGQSIYITKISKGNFAIKPDPQQQISEILPAIKMNFGFKLPVISIEKSVSFYRDFLGLSIKNNLNNMVTFQQGLVLVHQSYIQQFSKEQFNTLLYVEVKDIENKFLQAKEKNIYIISPLSIWKKSKRQFFICKDIDGNVVEVFGEESVD